MAPDDAEKAEGVAGNTWVTNQQVPVSNLPEVSLTSSDDVLKEYATRGFVPLGWLKAWLKKEKHPPRAFHGIPIEVKNRIWGVVVFDSRDPDEISAGDSEAFDVISRSLGKILERW